jgi:hypothetical protein
MRGFVSHPRVDTSAPSDGQLGVLLAGCVSLGWLYVRGVRIVSIVPDGGGADSVDPLTH